MPGSAVSFRIYPISSRVSGDGLILTPGPALSSVIAPLVTSRDTSRVLFPGAGLGRRLATVCSAVIQDAIKWPPSTVHFGLPQESPLLVIFFNSPPSAPVM